MPAMSHLMRPGENETSLPIMIGSSRQNSSRRQDKSTLLNFEKYLLAASPPINFAFSYGGTSRNNQTFADDINNNNNNKYCGVGSCGINANRLGGIDSKSSYQPNKETTNTNGSWTRKISLPISDKNSFGDRNRKTGIYSYNFKEAPGSNDFLISEICSAIGSGVSISTEKIFRSCLRSQILTERAEFKEPSVSPPRVKKVSFADCVGFPLINVRIFDEMPDTPSVVNPEVIRRHAAACSQASTASAATTPPSGGVQGDTKLSSTDIISTPRSCFLIPNFSMPAANYAEFREKVTNDFVSLESVHLSDHTGALVGTIKVKDVAFEKSVLLRCTFDEWASHKDVAATYVVPRIATPANVPSFSTFSFRLELPEDSRAGCKFAVRYETNGREYWDNNNGENYELVCPDWSSRNGSDTRYNRNSTEGVGFNSNDLKSEGGSWLGVDSSCPYY